MKRVWINCTLSALLLGASVAPAGAAPNILSDQLPPGETLASLGLGSRPLGPPERAVRLLEWGAVPGGDFCQQMAWWDDKIYCVLKGGGVIEYSLDGTQSAQPLLDVAAELGADFVNNGGSFDEGLRGFAFHPDYATNGLVYTMHRAANTGAIDLGFTTLADREDIVAEWDLDDLQMGSPTFREVVRIGFRGQSHRTNHIGFNPRAQPGDPDYGKLYCGIGDNTQFGGLDSHNVGQDFTTVLASVIRIDPLDPSAFSDGQLTAMGLKRGGNGKYAIPLDNPFVGHASFEEEIFAKGFRNTLTMNFTPEGTCMVGDVGQNSMEEINLVQNGGNYGWSIREGSFIYTFADQTTGAFLNADDSLRWVPQGDAGDPAITYQVRNEDGSNLRMETVARTGPQSDGLIYPVAQFSQEGNSAPTGNFSAVAGGQFYSGCWAEELTGLYLFGNFPSDTIYYIEASAITNDNQPAEVLRLPLVDASGNAVTLASIIGNERANMRFGADSRGNVYLASKTNGKIYRFQGTPEMKVDIEIADFAGQDAARISLTRPGPDPTLTYTLQGSLDLGPFTPLAGTEFEVLPTVPHPDGTETARFRFLPSLQVEPKFYFNFGVETVTGP